jgi:hypothetical protein
LEAEAYELEQRTALAAEAKSVLDSWVRYESQVKQRQQKELSQSIIAKVQKELENPKVLQQILQQSVADVESMFCWMMYEGTVWLTRCRDRLFQGSIDGYWDRAEMRDSFCTSVYTHLCANITLSLALTCLCLVSWCLILATYSTLFSNAMARVSSQPKESNCRT